MTKCLNHIKGEEIAINYNCYLIKLFKKKISRYSLKYKKSYYKNIYSKFKSIKDLLFYREDIINKCINLNLNISDCEKNIKYSDSEIIKEINNTVYYEILLNKINEL